MREECCEKGVDVNKDSGAGRCCELGAGVQADNLEYENRCGGASNRGSSPRRKLSETRRKSDHPPTTTSPITKRRNANTIGGKSCKPTFIEGEFPPQRNARSKLRAIILPCGSSLMTFGFGGVGVVSLLFKGSCYPD